MLGRREGLAAATATGRGLAAGTAARPRRSVTDHLSSPGTVWSLTVVSTVHSYAVGG